MGHHKCNSCGAAIIWAETITGRRMPLDLEPSTDGNIILGTRHQQAPLALVQTAQTLARLIAKGEKLYTSHFATCEFAAQHRRRNH
jgi:hypothetical protein